MPAFNMPGVELPQDIDSKTIQCLAPDETTVVQLAIGAGNQRGLVPSGAFIVEFSSTDACKVAFGNSSVDATSGTVRALPASVVVYRVPTGATNWAVTQVGTSSGFASMTKLV